ncbi:MAG: hypothetical protein P9L94_16845 [Candidatus Hinthialibacter antarcticus]|nr:hypothetical protein [Candidatus Hinthialibacter antarcticus]
MLRNSRLPSFNAQLFALTAATLLVFFWSACGGTPERNLPVDSQPQKVIEETPTPPITIIEAPTATQTPTPAPIEPKQEFGLIVRHSSTLESTDWIGLAQNYQATHIQIGGDAIRAVEDLIFQPQLQNQVRRLAREANQANLKVFVWSRELNLGDGLFRFDPTDPFYAARQSAYRNVLKSLPEIDGFVLQFADAQSPPWSAVADPTTVPQSSIKRIQIVIEMIKSIVVDEMGKTLWVRVGDEGPQAIEWLATALRTMNAADVGVILTQPTWLDAEFNRKAWISQLFGGQNVILEADATMNHWGGENTIISFAAPLNELRGFKDAFNFKGYACAIDTQDALVFDSPNRSNLVLLHQDEAPSDAVLQAWIEKEYQFAPVTKEGVSLRNLFMDSWRIAKKINTVQGADLFSFQWDVNNPPSFNSQSLNAPTEQTLLDIAQETYEAQSNLEETLSKLQEIQFNLPFTQISSLEQRIKNQIEFAKLMHYAKQCYWGYQLWKRTRNEQEALYLEGHLRALQQIASNTPQVFQLESERVDAGAILMFISNIRSHFPRVLFGSKERTWAKIFGIHIRQTAANSIEVLWQTSEPTVGSCHIVSKTPPLWQHSAESSLFPETEHRVLIEDLQPGQPYNVSISSTALNGFIINAKDYGLNLDEEVLF